MKRELKHNKHRAKGHESLPIAKPIPMKRELKLFIPHRKVRKQGKYCKAYPDEKGIETGSSQRFVALVTIIAKPIPMKRELKRDDPAPVVLEVIRNCKAYPDEKGIETKISEKDGGRGLYDCKAYPDEKGIETRRKNTNRKAQE